ncbi:oxalate oxidase GF-3.8, partial [Echria macrotheca]
DDIASPYGFPTRHITTITSDGSGEKKGTFSTTLLPATVTGYGFPSAAMAYDGYRVISQPVSLAGDKDVADFKESPLHPSAEDWLWFPGAGQAGVRYCDFAPGSGFPLHTTSTIDFGVVIFGTLECILDSGETRTLHPGDMIVQRGTTHAWRNPSDSVWTRGVFFILGAE